MASLTEIRDALAETLTDAISDVQGYARVADVAQVPAIVVMPDSCNFDGAFQRGMDEWVLNVCILVARKSFDSSQHELDQYVTGAGNKSIRQCVYTNPTLGLDDGTDAHASGVRGYGGGFDTARVEHVGAIVKVTVRTPGTA